MLQAKQPNFKVVLWVLLPVLFLLTLFGIKSLAVKSDLENRREIDELIRQQQALRDVAKDQTAVNATTSATQTASKQ